MTIIYWRFKTYAITTTSYWSLTKFKPDLDEQANCKDQRSLSSPTVSHQSHKLKSFISTETKNQQPHQTGFVNTIIQV